MKNKTLGEINLGTPADIGGMIIRPIAHERDTTLCLLQDLYKDGKDFEFGDNADWNDSPIREELNTKFYKELAEIVGEDNICTLKTDLWAWDGTRPFENCEDKIALLDMQQYRMHREHIDATGNWNWLLTPDSETWSSRVCYVCDDGTLGYGYCDIENTVRPFFNLKSNILVSKEGK